MEITSMPTLLAFRLRTKEVTILVSPAKVTITSSKRESPFEITAPGEYEVLDVSVFAYPHGTSLTFHLVADGLSLVYAGGESGKLPEEVFDQFDEVAVLFAPTAESASVSQVEPRYLVLTQPDSSLVAIDKLVVQAGKLPEEREVVMLDGRN
ncbi:MAG: hypothetical protein ABH807_00200 [Candidatus Shapirobacteria bacterium]